MPVPLQCFKPEHPKRICVTLLQLNRERRQEKVLSFESEVGSESPRRPHRGAITSSHQASGFLPAKRSTAPSLPLAGGGVRREGVKVLASPTPFTKGTQHSLPQVSCKDCRGNGGGDSLSAAWA